MHLPILYQPNVACDDSTMRFMRMVMDIWNRTEAKKPSLLDMDEYAEFCRLADDLSVGRPSTLTTVQVRFPRG